MEFALQTIFEFILVVAVFWSIFNEDKLIRFEKKIISNIRRKKLKVIKTKGYSYNGNI